MSGLKHTM